MPLVELPDDMREELKEPLGPVETEVRDVSGRLLTVGDVVTSHFVDAGYSPDLALVDGRTKRQEVDEDVRESVERLQVLGSVDNPAGCITRELLEEVAENLDGEGALHVDGEEDLAVLPVIVVADDGDTVVYGQPDEGMVYVDVDEETRDTAVDLLFRMDLEDETELNRLLGL